MQELLQVLRAAHMAATWHVDQRRKGTAREPYINHLLEVAALVCEATHGADSDLVIAALLHDAVEDQEISFELIASTFGESVSALVKEVTDDKSLPKEERKRLQVEHAPEKSERAAILKLADLTSNLRSLDRSTPDGWSLERRLDYVQWARNVAAGLSNRQPWLEGRFDEAATNVEKSLTPA